MAVLLGEWGFLDNLSDTSGNGHTATATGFTPSYVTGPTTGTKAIQFTATGQTISYGRTGLEPAAGTGGVTTMGWVYLGSPVPGYLGVCHHSRDGAGSTRAGFMLNNGKFRPMSRWRDQLAFSDGIGSDLSTTGWHHLAVVDGENRYQWYVDGVSVQTATRTDHTTAVTWENFAWISGYQAGTSEPQSAAALRVSGIRIFSGELTTTEINTWMNTPITGGASPTTGTASGSVTVAATGTGSRASSGTASGSATVVGSATGSRAPEASGTGSILVAGTATGLKDPEGSASGSLLFSGTASGLSPVTGSGSGTVELAGTGTGSTPVAGSGSGSVAVVGAASGTTVIGGSGTGQVLLVGSGSGIATRGGTSTGHVTVHGVAVGRSAPSRDITIIATTGPKTHTVASRPGTRLRGSVPGSRWTATAPER